MISKRQYKETELLVSSLGLGCMRLPCIEGKQDIDYKKAQEIVDEAYAGGVNYFDTAYNYHEGLSEAFTGHALKKYPRDSYLVASKFPVWEVKTKEDVARIFQEQRSRTGLDYFDFYLLHAMNAESFQKCQEFGVIEFLDEMKRQGKIRRFGFSFHDKPTVLKKICDAHEWDFAQIQLNYLDWKDQNARLQYETLTKRGIPVIVMEPVRGGALADPGEEAAALFRAVRPHASPASWAIRFAASLPNVLTILSGMSSLEQVRDNVETLTSFQPLTSKERKVMEEALAAYRKKEALPCTGCRYCMDCPHGVNIPGVFHAYNGFAFNGVRRSYMEEYFAMPESARANNCCSCGQCLQHCPQGIDIPGQMKKIESRNRELGF